MEAGRLLVELHTPHGLLLATEAPVGFQACSSWLFIASGLLSAMHSLLDEEWPSSLAGTGNLKLSTQQGSEPQYGCLQRVIKSQSSLELGQSECGQKHTCTPPSGKQILGAFEHCPAAQVAFWCAPDACKGSSASLPKFQASQLDARLSKLSVIH